MEKLFIEATSATPEINFDGDRGFFSISGKSYPENVLTFYAPVIEYIEEYKTQSGENVVLEFNWLYYNTSTSKMIIKIIVFLKDIGKDLKVKWYCKDDFDLMIEKGNEIKEILDVDFEIILTSPLGVKTLE